MNVPARPERLCPLCGRVSGDTVCPRDAVPTVGMRPFARRPDSFGAGEVVAERYRITEALGSGGFSCVYGAEHTGTGQALALKLLAVDDETGESTAIRRFVREARVTAALSHPNTVRVFDVGQDQNGPLFIAMERIRGVTLSQALREHRTAGTALSEREVLDIGSQVLGSLAEAHSQGIVHRDLKPSNLMLTAGPEGDRIVKVLDFGVARTSGSSLTQPGFVQGTPSYMSPEQCLGKEVDGRSDLYALAVVLFACATKQLPFDHTDPLEVMHMHAFKAPPDPTSFGPMSQGLAGCLLRGLAKSPNDRFADAGQMRDALLAVRDGLSSDPTPRLAAPVRPRSGKTPAGTSAGPADATQDGPLDWQPDVPIALSLPEQPSGRPRTQRRPVVAAVLVAVGMLAGWWLLRVPTGSGPTSRPIAPRPPSPPPVVQAADAAHLAAKAAFDLAASSTSLEGKLEHAREAARLAPDVPAYARLVAVLQTAPLAVAAPVPVLAAPTPAAVHGPASRKRRPARAREDGPADLVPAQVD